MHSGTSLAAELTILEVSKWVEAGVGNAPKLVQLVSNSNE